MRTSRTLLLVVAALVIAGLIVWYAVAQRTAESDEALPTDDIELLNESADDFAALEEDLGDAEELMLEDTKSTPDESAAEEEDASAIADVAVTPTGFDPASLTIKAGDTVVWSNNAGRAVYIAPDVHPTHTKYEGVWDDDGTGNIAEEEAYEFTFEQLGTYTYHNHLQTTMTGTIIVE